MGSTRQKWTLSCQRLTVKGNVDVETLIKKLVKSGKHAELWPEPSKPDKKDKKPANDSEQHKEPKPCKKNAAEHKADASADKANKESDPLQSKGPEDPTPGADPLEQKDENTPENPPPPPPAAAENPAGGQGGGGGGGGKKKKKGGGGGGSGGGADGGGAPGNGAPPPGPPPSQGPPPPPVGQMGAQAMPVNMGPHAQPPPMYHHYPPAAAHGQMYGTCYNVAQPSVTTSLYAPPTYGYTQPGYASYPPAPGPSMHNDRYDHYGYYDDNEGGCSIM